MLQRNRSILHQRLHFFVSPFVPSPFGPPRFSVGEDAVELQPIPPGREVVWCASYERLYLDIKVPEGSLPSFVHLLAIRRAQRLLKAAEEECREQIQQDKGSSRAAAVKLATPFLWAAG